MEYRGPLSLIAVVVVFSCLPEWTVQYEDEFSRLLQRYAIGNTTTSAEPDDSTDNITKIDINILCKPISISIDGTTNLEAIDWKRVDRRCEEGWWNLYPFGEKYDDIDVSGYDEVAPTHKYELKLNFHLLYFGYRFNSIRIFTSSFIAFSYPEDYYMQPPYVFPEPNWPYKPDPSLIALYLVPQSHVSVADTKLSHVWYRTVSSRLPRSPQPNEGKSSPTSRNNGLRCRKQEPSLQFQRRRDLLMGQDCNEDIPKASSSPVQDLQLLDKITNNIRNGMVGAGDFTANYAIIVTWEQLANGGAPIATSRQGYNQMKDQLNTYQLVIATDEEARTYSIFNYANLNLTSSTSSGALFGRRREQPAVVGFNGGNGTGFYEMPYNADKLVQYNSTQTAGRWLARIDEDFEYGGCTNYSRGSLQLSNQYGIMLGGFTINVSGPCFMPRHIIKLQLHEITVDCQRLNIAKAICVIPIGQTYHIGATTIKLSIDGGRTYNFWNKFNIVPPNFGDQALLVTDPSDNATHWDSYFAQNLTIQWSASSLSYDPNATVDISLWGYWEEPWRHEFKKIAYITRNERNTGVYSFNPLNLESVPEPDDPYNAYLNETNQTNWWHKFMFGVVQVRISGDSFSTNGDGLYWSRIVPFGWYHRARWEREYGTNFTIGECLNWYYREEAMHPFLKELDDTYPCPCTLDQAILDHGRFRPQTDCSIYGSNSGCDKPTGAVYCIISTYATWFGASKQCCYDHKGALMVNREDENGSTAPDPRTNGGFPRRAHPLGSYPYKRPPFVPGFSDYFNDVLPRDLCCTYVKACELYYACRNSSGCQFYEPPVTGYAYSNATIVTFDGMRYDLAGTGFYVLSKLNTQIHNMMIQARVEKAWHAENVSIITGIAANDNYSATVEIYARKQQRRLRHKMGIYVDGQRVFFDKDYKILQRHRGLTLYTPMDSADDSIIWIYFETGVAVRVAENNGGLNCEVVLPYNYNISYVNHFLHGGLSMDPNLRRPYRRHPCYPYVLRTMGLLGTWNGRREDDLTLSNCTSLLTPDSETDTIDDSSGALNRFTDAWRVDGARSRMLFSLRHKPLFGNPDYPVNEL